MIMKVLIEANTLQEWHDELFKRREKNLYARHKNPLTLTAYHQLIHDLVNENDSYTEFGICQGHSLAAALLAKPKKVRAYDITFDLYTHSGHLFDQFAEENGIDFRVYETDSGSCDIIDETDILHIDSLHTYEHCKKELTRHGHRVKKYILLHDTSARPELFKAVREFINDDWEIVDRCNTGVGYTLIKRK